MWVVVKKILALALVVILVFAFVGCAGKKPAQGELTREELDRIIADAVAAIAEVDTFKFDMNVSMAMEVIGGAEVGEMTLVADSAGTVNNANKEMQMSVSMAAEMLGEGREDMVMEFYIVGGWMYTKMDVPGVGERWARAGLTEEAWKTQSQMSQQIEFLETAEEVKLLGEESVRGTACYVVEMVPSKEALGDLMSQQAFGMDLGDLALADLFKEIYVTEWIARDNCFLMKSEIDVLMDISAKDIGATEEDFGTMTMDVNMEFAAYDYNEPVSIELPEEALEAQEVPES